MAHFIPISNPEGFNYPCGEMKVYEALKSLSDDYTVMYSVNWVGIERRTIGEADFVIIHPDHGILVIEVKSGNIDLKEGEWLQTNTSSWFVNRIDPLRQARRNMYEFMEHLKEKCTIRPIPMLCYCAWFPSVTVPGSWQLPPEAPKEILLDKKSLDKPDSAIAACFSYWEKKYENVFPFGKMNQKQMQEVKDILSPCLHLVADWKTNADENEQSYIQLTEQQTLLLDFLVEQKTAAIHGEAGTGKTLLAREKAKRIASQNESVLFLCFNDLLLEDLRAKKPVPNVTFHNARSLNEELVGKREFEGDVRTLLSENLDILEEDEWRYRNIIIDEGQDLGGLLMERLWNRVKRVNGCFYVFYDRNQFIQLPKGEKKVSDWLDKQAECKLVLHRNCRNTAEVFKTSCSFVDVDNIVCNNLHGEKPQVRFYRKDNELEAIVTEFLTTATSKGFSPENVVILTAETQTKSKLSVSKGYGGLQLSDKKEKGKVLFTTIRKFKGLEADAVLIVDVSISDLKNKECMKNKLLYAGTSRSKYLLRIAVREDVRGEKLREIVETLDPAGNVPRTKSGWKQLFNLH